MSTACIAHKTAIGVTSAIAMTWALVTLGCGGDDGGGGEVSAGSGAPAAAGASGGSQAGAGGAGVAGTAGMDGQLPDTSVECEDDAIPCRGECFREVGEAHNGCELIARSGSDSGISAIAVTEQAIFATDSARSENISAPPGRLFRFDPPDYRVTELKIENRFDDKLVADGGFIYVNAGYVDADGSGNLGLLRIAQDGGELELLVDPLPDRADPIDFEVLDGHAWYYIDGLHRVPVAGGEPELILDRAIDSIALDATHYYFHAGFPDFDIERSPRSDPAQAEVLVGDNVPTAMVLLLDSDPDHLYYYRGVYLRVPKTGGEPEVLSDRRFTSLNAGVGSEHLFAATITADEQPGSYAISRQDGAVLRIDDTAATRHQIGEDSQAFYIGRRNALLRIAKDQL